MLGVLFALDFVGDKVPAIDSVLHATRATIRPVSTTMTAGAGNPVLSLGEDIGSAMLSVVAVFAPILGAIGLIVVVAVAILWWRRIRRSRRRRGLP